MSRDRPRPPELPLRRGLLLLPLLVAGALAGACDGVTEVERGAEPLVRTDAPTYTWQETRSGDGLRVEIPYRYENRTNRTIFLPHCRGGFLVGLVDESGDLVWSPILLMCASHPPIAIAAGETLHDTLRVFHGLEPNSYPRMEGDREGVFRIDVMAATWSDDGGSSRGEVIPPHLRVSNPFELVRE